LCEQLDAPLKLRVTVIHTIGQLLRVVNLREYAARIIHPFSRILEAEARHSKAAEAASKLPVPRSPLVYEIMEVLCVLAHRLNSGYVLFIPMISRVLAAGGTSHALYNSLVSKIVKGVPLLQSDLPPSSSLEHAAGLKRVFSDQDIIVLDDGLDDDQNAKKLRVSQPNLKKV
jgi:FKBP12-rapamycin complex-associated protein